MEHDNTITHDPLPIYITPLNIFCVFCSPDGFCACLGSKKPRENVLGGRKKEYITHTSFRGEEFRASALIIYNS